MKRYLIIISILLILVVGFVSLTSLIKCYYLTFKYQDYDFVKEGKYHFILVLKEDDVFWNKVVDGAKKAAKKYNVTLSILKEDYFDIDSHLDLIDRGIESSPDGIISYTLNEKKYENIVNRAIDKKIPFISLDVDVLKSKRDAFIGTNNYYTGIMLAKKLIKAIDNKGLIGIVMNSEENSFMLTGIYGEVSRYDGVSIIDTRYIDTKRVNTYKVIEDMVINNRELKGIICIDPYATYMAGQVIVRQNKVGKIKIVGMGDLDGTLRFIKKGVIEGTVVRDPYKMGYKAVETMYKIKEEEFIDDTIFIELKYINKGSLDEK
ncbi:hypothetical protein TR13x_08875 [Caloranaerobacter sp. TR13]|uniref:substrate-binding domain-containing protein n=1 Tax=Caloranaerobacter sp. TR13 TaxID=1302151 RepID=UPI0006D436BA|nr:substrate-binding domain-containing protein [Caloranaerobacter sp. TR13]KPU26682.1 hypothetical protein TR13x_08875 [Caloranaerobacter sp. TR13]